MATDATAARRALEGLSSTLRARRWLAPVSADDMNHRDGWIADQIDAALAALLPAPPEWRCETCAAVAYAVTPPRYCYEHQHKWQAVPPAEPAPHRCKFCGAPSSVDPSDQEAPPDYCHPENHVPSSWACLYCGNKHLNYVGPCVNCKTPYGQSSPPK